MQWATRAFAEGIAGLALGFWLPFGTSGIVRLLRKLRDVGLEPSNRE